MNERICDYKIIAYINGKRLEIVCDPSKGCLRELVWSGSGVNAAAAKALGIPDSGNIEASTEGDCLIKES